MNSRSEQDIVAGEQSVILKPTGLCNANCKFCYAINFINKAKSVDYLDEKFIKYIEDNSIKNIILTGGEITLVPTFLNELCEYAKKKDITVSLVSNLIEIVNNRNYWKNFFIKYPKLFLTGSYQTDTERCDKVGKKLNQEDFLNFVEWYNKRLKKHLLIIAVLNDNNENSILTDLYLAKKYKYTLSIERQIGVGKADSEYLPLKYFKLLNKIIDLGLWKYEKHLRLFVQCGLFDLHYCNFYCKKMVPVIYLNKRNELIVTGCDHLSTTNNDITLYTKTTPLKKECIFCKYYNLCQGCHITRKNIKDYEKNNFLNTSIYCEEIKKVFEEFEKKIINIRGKNGKQI